MKKISLNKLLKIKDPIIIDIRDHNDFLKYNIYGSINIPYLEIYNNYLTYLKKDILYYIICDEGFTSKKLVTYLTKHKYNVVHVKGGISKLIKSNL